MLSVGGDASWQTFRSAPGGGLVLVELLDEASSLDHTPVELLIESKFLVGSECCAALPPHKLAFFHGDGGVLLTAPLRFRPRGSGAPTIGTIQLGKGERGSTFCDRTGT